ncbi:hypothetical protein KL918_003431 [Ogataea parapolymorpha]|nr:hypothetical protein KL918_003431 [Ogataea parapolymorpha]KAG7872530.1 hypothetical protein KL916_002925 [Ogataea parapolymorpha]
MFGKQDQQNSTETDDLKAKLNYGAEKEKQIMNEIRNGNKAKSFSQLFESSIGGNYFSTPFTSLFKDGRIHSLTDQNIYSVLNSSTGEVLYRYQSDTPIQHDSVLSPAWDGLVACGFNHEAVSRIVFWAKDGLIERELDLGSLAGIHNVRDEVLLAVQKNGSVLQIDKDYGHSTVAHVGPVNASKLAFFADQLVLVTKSSAGTAYKVLDGQEGRLGCQFDDVLVTDEGIVCNKDIYKLESGKLQRYKNSPLAALAAKTARIVNSQYLVTVGENIQIYDLDEPSRLIDSYGLEYPADLIEADTVDGKVAAFVVSGNDLLLFVEGELVWARDESLAEIGDIVIIDRHEELSVTFEDFEHEKHWSGYIDRLKHNLHLLFQEPHKDTDKHFGFNKTIIVLSGNGNLYGYDSYGHLEWSIKGQGFSRIFRLDNQAYAANERLYIVQDGKLLETDVKEEQKALYPPNLDDSYRLLTTAARGYNNTEVASPAVVLASRRVLYKYLNPQTSVGVFYNENSALVKFVVYNKATNQTYASFEHSTKNPESLKLVFEENFIIFTTSEKNAETSILGVIELYESLTPDQRSKVPEHHVRTYVFPAKVAAMTVTRTKYNIASKWLIVALESGEIVAIPRTLANARRPIDVSKKPSEEMLMKYQPVLPINPKLTLSHYRKIIGTKKLVSVPTELESTTLVVGAGTDLFATLVRPSSSFDSMRGDFSKTTLLATIAVLVVSILVVRPFVNQKRVKDVWQTRI